MIHFLDERGFFSDHLVISFWHQYFSLSAILSLRPCDGGGFGHEAGSSLAVSLVLLLLLFLLSLLVHDIKRLDPGEIASEQI